MLGVALSQVQRRMDLMAADTTDPAELNIHHWQRHNPVATEALLQLTTGTPQLLYNGGLLPLRVLYLDPDRGRPGLPPDVAALVDTVEPDRTGLQLVNLSATADPPRDRPGRQLRHRPDRRRHREHRDR